MKQVGLEEEPLTCLREQRLLHGGWAVPHRGRHLPKDFAQLSFEVFAFLGLVLVKAEEETRAGQAPTARGWTDLQSVLSAGFRGWRSSLGTVGSS